MKKFVSHRAMWNGIQASRWLLRYMECPPRTFNEAHARFMCRWYIFKAHIWLSFMKQPVQADCKMGKDKWN